MLARLGVLPGRGREVLEVGVGAGTEHPFVSEYGRVTGLELSELGLRHARKQGYERLEKADLNVYRPEPGRFDLLFDLHVLYHREIEEPARVLHELAQGLKPGGRLVVTEPAFEFLRRDHDRAVMGARRFSRHALRSLVENAGLLVERQTAFTSLLMPLVIGRKVWDLARRDDAPAVGELEVPSRSVGRTLARIMRAERALTTRFDLPYGTSWALIARRI